MSKTLNFLTPNKVIAILPSLEEMNNIVDKVYNYLPTPYKQKIKTLKVMVENFPPEDILNSLHLTNKFDLLGLYQGVPLIGEEKKASFLAAAPVSTIFLYRAPLIKYARDKKEIFEDLVQHVLLHEIRHHFGCTEQIKLKFEQKT